MTVQMKCPTPVASTIVTSKLNTYTPDVYGYIQAQNVDVLSLLQAGFIVVPVRDNLAAAVDPTATDDSGKDYGVGSRWYNTTNGSIWNCLDPTTTAAVWYSDQVTLIGKLIAANMNVTTDQSFVMNISGTARYRITKITAENASVNLTTAAGGIYPAATKGGTALVASTQAYSALTAATIALDLTLAVPNTIYAGTVVPILSLTTAQGAPATADFYMYGDRYV